MVYGSALFVVLLIRSAGSSKNNRKYEQQVTTEQAALRTIIETVVANGKIEPALEVKISPYISGEVVELLCAKETMCIKAIN